MPNSPEEERAPQGEGGFVSVKAYILSLLIDDDNLEKQPDAPEITQNDAS